MTVEETTTQQTEETTTTETTEETTTQTEENTDENSSEQNSEQNDGENKEENTQETSNKAPETYNFDSVELPKGMELDKDLLGEFSPLAKEDNLTQAQADRYVKLAAKLVQKQSTSMVEQLQQAAEAQKIAYQKELNADKEIYGGDTKQTDTYLDTADKGYKFLSEETRNELAKYNLNYCKSLIKDMNRLGKLFEDDKLPDVKNPSGAELSPAEILYGNTQN